MKYEQERELEMVNNVNFLNTLLNRENIYHPASDTCYCNVYIRSEVTECHSLFTIIANNQVPRKPAILSFHHSLEGVWQSFRDRFLNGDGNTIPNIKEAIEAGKENKRL